MRLSWPEVGLVEEECTIPFQDGVLVIRPQQIELWREDPKLTFEVVRGGPAGLRTAIYYLISAHVDRKV